MDIIPLNNSENLIKLNNSKRITCSSGQAAQPSSASSCDKINLSNEAQSLIRRDGASANTTNHADTKQKKISISDNKDIVLEILDTQTNEVVRSVPSKEQLDLRRAVRKEIDKL